MDLVAAARQGDESAMRRLVADRWRLVTARRGDCTGCN
jgi:hypothetical protein